jgi:adenosylhomocysteine nucleosidase
MNLAWLVRQWLQQQARAGVRDAVAHAAQGGQAGQPNQTGAQGSDAASSEPPPPCDIGLVFALPQESGAFVDLLSGVVTTKGRGFIVRSGVLADRRIVVVEAGAGREAAARGTHALIGGHRPLWVISAGFAGGLQADLQRGDFVLADEIDDVSGRRLAIDLKAEPDPRARVRVGRLLTVDQLVRGGEEKRSLGEKHGALAVDMESWAVGDVCRQDKVRFLAVRVISDAIDEELPAELDSLVAQRTTAGRLGAAAGILFRRPSSIKDMWRLKEQAMESADRLAQYLKQIVDRLPPRERPPTEVAATPEERPG